MNRISSLTSEIRYSLESAQRDLGPQKKPQRVWLIFFELDEMVMVVGEEMPRTGGNAISVRINRKTNLDTVTAKVVRQLTK